MTTNTTHKNEIEAIVELIAETKLSRLETAMKVREILTQLNANRTAEMEAMVREILTSVEVLHDDIGFHPLAVSVVDIKAVAQAHGITIN